MEKYDEETLLAEIKKKNLTKDEISNIIKGLRQEQRSGRQETEIDFPDRRVRFIAFSDVHIGHKCYRPDVFRKMIADAKRQDIEFFVCGGDTIEGMSNREGHIYELTHIGASEQLDYFQKEFSLLTKPCIAIEAQDSHGGWFHNKSNMGLNIGEELARRCKKYRFIGYDEQDIRLTNGLKLRIRHPGSGTAYALSYKQQKYIEAISGGDKPQLLLTGHFHKSLYMFYRNVHSIDTGCLCSQTPFMRKIGTPAHVGYWIIDANMHRPATKGVERINISFVPFYD